MCTSFTPPTIEQLRNHFGAVVNGMPEYPAHAYKDYLTPIIRRGADGSRVVDMASFGFTPHRHIPPHIKPWDSMNARSETIATKRTFAQAWRNCQLCLVPMQNFWEPNWQTGSAVRYKIGMADDRPFAVAGLWREWKEADGTTSLSVTMITMNADDHPLLNLMHKPSEPPDKRSLIIIPEEEWDIWLDCKDPEIARTFFKLYPAELMRGVADPAPPRSKKPKPPEPPIVGDLFS